MNKYIIKNPTNDYITYLRDKCSMNKLKYSLVCSNEYVHTENIITTCYKPSCLTCRVNLFENSNEDLINKIDNNDKVWAIQNLQSNNKNIKIVAQYIFNNNNDL